MLDRFSVMLESMITAIDEGLSFDGIVSVPEVGLEDFGRRPGLAGRLDDAVELFQTTKAAISRVATKVLSKANDIRDRRRRRANSRNRTSFRDSGISFIPDGKKHVTPSVVQSPQEPTLPGSPQPRQPRKARRPSQESPATQDSTTSQDSQAPQEPPPTQEPATPSGDPQSHRHPQAPPFPGSADVRDPPKGLRPSSIPPSSQGSVTQPPQEPTISQAPHIDERSTQTDEASQYGPTETPNDTEKLPRRRPRGDSESSDPGKRSPEEGLEDAARERVDTPLGVRETFQRKHEPSDPSASQQFPSEGSGRIRVQPTLSRDGDSPAPPDPSSSRASHVEKSSQGQGETELVQGQLSATSELTEQVPVRATASGLPRRQRDRRESEEPRPEASDSQLSKLQPDGRENEETRPKGSGSGLPRLQQGHLENQESRPEETSSRERDEQVSEVKKESPSK